MTEKGVPPQSSQRTVAFWTSVYQTNLLLLFGTYIHDDTSFLVARNTSVAQGDGKRRGHEGRDEEHRLASCIQWKGSDSTAGQAVVLEMWNVPWGEGMCELGVWVLQQGGEKFEPDSRDGARASEST